MNTSSSGVLSSFESEPLYLYPPSETSPSWPRSKRLSLLTSQSNFRNNEARSYEANTLHYSQPRKSQPTPARPQQSMNQYGALSLEDFGDINEPLGAGENRISRRQTLQPKIVEMVLEVVIGGWAIYNTTRYLITFSNGGISLGYGLSLFLGISAALSTGAAFASLTFPCILAFSRTAPSHSTLPLRRVRIAFSLLASSFTEIPAITNLVLTTVWRNEATAPSFELDYTQRCHWDIDVIWSGPTKAVCVTSNKAAWSTWLAAAIIRFILTNLILAAYIGVKFRQNQIAARDGICIARTSISHFNPDDLYQNNTTNTEAVEYESGAPAVRHTSENTLHSSLPSPPRKLRRRQSETPSEIKTASQQKRPFSSLGSSELKSMQVNDGRLSSESANSASSASPIFDKSMTNGYPYIPSVQNQSTIYSDASGERTGQYGYPYPSDGDLEAFANHIRSLIVSQDSLPISPTSADIHTNSGTSSPVQDLTSEPFRNERVVILNQTIRRMPTIESFGSREISETTINTGGARTGTGSIGSVAPSRTNTIASDDITDSPRSSLRRRMSTGPAAARVQPRLQDFVLEAFNQEPLLCEHLVQTPEAK